MALFPIKSNMVGMHATEWLPPSLMEKFQADALEVTTTGQAKVTEIEITLIGSSPCWYEIIKNPIPDANGQIIAMVGIWIDIQAHKQNKMVMQTAEQQSKTLSTAIPGVIFQLCQATDGVLSFRYISSTCYQLCQISANAIMANADCLLGLMHHDDVGGLKIAIDISADALTPLLWTGRLVLTSGDAKWIKIAARPEANAQGGIVWDGVLLGGEEPIHFAPQNCSALTNVPATTVNRLEWSFSQSSLAQSLSTSEHPILFLEQVKTALVELLPAGQCSATGIAKKLGVSPRTLRRRLKDEGTTFKSTVSQMRLALAKHYLSQSDLTCKHIATLIGYDDPSSFTRAFHTATGTTPEEFRKTQGLLEN